MLKEQLQILEHVGISLNLTIKQTLPLIDFYLFVNLYSDYFLCASSNVSILQFLSECLNIQFFRTHLNFLLNLPDLLSASSTINKVFHYLRFDNLLTPFLVTPVQLEHIALLLHKRSSRKKKKSVIVRNVLNVFTKS